MKKEACGTNFPSLPTRVVLGHTSLFFLGFFFRLRCTAMCNLVGTQTASHPISWQFTVSRFFRKDILIFVGFCLLSEAFIIHPISPLKLNTSSKRPSQTNTTCVKTCSVGSQAWARPVVSWGRLFQGGWVNGWSPSIMGSKTPGVRKRYEIISVSYVIICYCISYMCIVVCKKICYDISYLRIVVCIWLLHV